jgi:hypothetical protein
MKLIPAAVASKIGRPLLHLQKASPQVMFAGGIVAGGAGVVLACRSTLKLSDTLDKYDELKEKAEVLFDEGNNTEYDEKAYGKDLTVIKVKTILDVTKLYAPAAGLLMISAALLTGSHVTLNRRNASIAAAYAATDKAFKEYQERVTEKYGRDVHDEIRYGSRTVEETVEGTDGKKKTIKKKQVDDELPMPSQYARFFDELCEPHKRDPEINKIFLQSQQAYFNDLLKVKGYVFLNDVYRALDLPESKAGQMVGWVIGKNGDNYVDFGIFDTAANPKVRDFVNGREYSILLDFNVDGIILDHLKD